MFTCCAAMALVRSVTILPRSRSCEARQMKSCSLSSLPSRVHVVSIRVISFVYILREERRGRGA